MMIGPFAIILSSRMIDLQVYHRFAKSFSDKMFDLNPDPHYFRLLYYPTYFPSLQIPQTRRVGLDTKAAVISNIICLHFRTGDAVGYFGMGDPRYGYFGMGLVLVASYGRLFL